ncbi:MAG: chorismate mutase [Alphaproteobacteria bacterium]|nr:chorismate mutase [Alphaproteobacteria bacterium]
MSKKLDQIRRKIDSLDDRIHDALMERAGLVEGIITEKRKNNLPFIQPAREAQMIRRLLERHEGCLPPEVIVRIWRELVTAVSLLQTGVKISISTEGASGEIWDMARNYFGSATEMQKLSGSLSALASVREGNSTFAVLPWPEDEAAHPWWVVLFNHPENDLRIVGALPYGMRSESRTSGKALIVSKIDFSPSGKDRSFLALEVDQGVSRDRILKILRECALTPLGIHSRKKENTAGAGFHLIEVEGYVSGTDENLKAIGDRFETGQGRCAVIGGYPVPPSV